MSQWVAREYLARRGHAPFQASQLQPARCPLLGYALTGLTVEGTPISRWFLQVNQQPEVGDEAYDRGAEILADFFHRHLRGFLHADLAPLGREIVNCCLDGGGIQDYAALIRHDTMTMAASTSDATG